MFLATCVCAHDRARIRQSALPTRIVYAALIGLRPRSAWFLNPVCDQKERRGNTENLVVPGWSTSTSGLQHTAGHIFHHALVGKCCAHSFPNAGNLKWKAFLKLNEIPNERHTRGRTVITPKTRSREKDLWSICNLDNRTGHSVQSRSRTDPLVIITIQWDGRRSKIGIVAQDNDRASILKIFWWEGSKPRKIP